ncbi:MAG: hypothetical protein LBD62_02600 [Candidatus Margulisbacteria bacterium]|jgi:hypothetical protein|nr:hypothetical protein [Candidatus Margulisiibacteriota bacterium]
MRHKIISSLPDIIVGLNVPMSIIVDTGVSVPAWKEVLYYASGQVKRVVVARPVKVYYGKDYVLLKQGDVILFDEHGKIDKIKATSGKTRIINGEKCSISGNGDIFLF